MYSLVNLSFSILLVIFVVVEHLSNFKIQYFYIMYYVCSLHCTADNSVNSVNESLQMKW